MIILGIESSCDETAVALVKDKKEVLIIHSRKSRLMCIKNLVVLFQKLPAVFMLKIFHIVLMHALKEARMYDG